MSHADRVSEGPSDLTRLQYISYGLFAAPLSIALMAMSSFIPAYYSEYIGLDLPTVAGSLLMLRVADAVIDPLIGTVIDRIGWKRKHKIITFASSVLMALGVALLYFPPPTAAGRGLMLFSGFVTFFMYTIAVIAHQSWAASVVSRDNAISRIFAVRELFTILGILCAFLIAAAASHLLGAGVRYEAQSVGLLIIVLLVVSCCLLLRFVPDEGEEAVASQTKFSDAWPFLRQRGLVCLLLVHLFLNVGFAATAALSFYVAKYIYALKESFAVGLFSAFLVAPIGLAFWTRLAAKLGNIAALTWSCGWMIAATMMLPLTASFGLVGYIIYNAAAGIGFGGAQYLSRSVAASLAAAETHKTGLEVRATTFAAVNFLDKFGSGFGVAALMIVAWLGLDQGHTGPVNGAGVPLFLPIVTAILVLSYLLALTFSRGVQSYYKNPTRNSDLSAFQVKEQGMM